MTGLIHPHTTFLSEGYYLAKGTTRDNHPHFFRGKTVLSLIHLIHKCIQHRLIRGLLSTTHCAQTQVVTEMSITLEYFLTSLHLREVSWLGYSENAYSSPTPLISVLWTYFLLPDFQLYLRSLYNLSPTGWELFRTRSTFHSRKQPLQPSLFPPLYRSSSSPWSKDMFNPLLKSSAGL